jgi:hypothetical protein
MQAHCDRFLDSKSLGRTLYGWLWAPCLPCSNELQLWKLNRREHSAVKKEDSHRSLDMFISCTFASFRTSVYWDWIGSQESNGRHSWRKWFPNAEHAAILNAWSQVFFSINFNLASLAFSLSW